ncbi:MAG TPA: SRPBCC domain-containing protein [Candidatus Limnocylindrales bacterium]|nr:SRPBCC domain-containing protein [Candidatus Limnocylindrales bacterium]
MTNTTAVASIEREAEFAAEPQRVWRALTDPAELSRWWCQAASFELRPGAIGWMEWTEHGRYAIRIEVVEPGRRLVWRGARDRDTSLDEGRTTTVEFTLSPGVRGGTLLTIREDGFVRDADRIDNVLGWFGTVAGLSEYLATEPWERGIRRTWSFRSSPERVWRAFSDPADFLQWWGGTEQPEIREGYEGWFVWPTEGRHAMRIDRVEPPTYLAWRWSMNKDVAFEDSTEVLRTEWAIMPRPDGGTDVHLLETGFRNPANFRENSNGWDTDVEPALRRHFGEA